MLVADLGLQPEHAEVIAHDPIDIIAVLMVGLAGIGRGPDVVMDVFDNARAAFDADVPRMVTGEGWSGDGERGDPRAEA